MLVDHVSQSRAVSTILLYNVVSFSVELMIVAVAAPIMVLLVPMPSTLRWLMILTGAVCFAIALGDLRADPARRARQRRAARDADPGARARQLRRWIWKSSAPSRYLLSQARYERWQDRLRAVDSKMQPRVRRARAAIAGSASQRSRCRG